MDCPLPNYYSKLARNIYPFNSLIFNSLIFNKTGKKMQKQIKKYSLLLQF